MSRHSFSKTCFLGLASFVCMYPTYNKLKTSVHYKSMENSIFNSPHSQAEMKKVAQITSGFYDSNDEAAAQKVNFPVKNNQKLADSTYIFTFDASPSNNADADSVDLREVISDAKTLDKKSILFTYRQEPASGFRMPLANAEYIQKHYSDVKTQLDLNQDIPLYVLSSSDFEAYAGTKPSSWNYDRWTAISVGTLNSQSTEELDFTSAHELGHHKISSDEKGMFHALGEKLKNFLLNKFEIKDIEEPHNEIFFIKSKLEELDADSIGVTHSNFKAAIKCFTSFDFAKHKKSLSSSEVIDTWKKGHQDEMNDVESTHPEHYFRMNKVTRIHHKP